HGEQALVEVDDAVDGHPVDLDVLARRDVCDPAPIAVRHVGEAVELVGGEHAARYLDALHVARVVELVVEAVGEADRAPLVPRELAADEAVGPALVAREGAQVLLWGGTHRSGIAAQSKHYGRGPASKSTRKTRRCCPRFRGLRVGRTTGSSQAPARAASRPSDPSVAEPRPRKA